MRQQLVRDRVRLQAQIEALLEEAAIDGPGTATAPPSVAGIGDVPRIGAAPGAVPDAPASDASLRLTTAAVGWRNAGSRYVLPQKNMTLSDI